MKNLNFFEKLWEHSRTLRRVGLVLVMCLITITQAYAYKITGGHTIYFDNSIAEWTGPQMQVKQNDSNKPVYEFTQIGTTSFYYKVFSNDWDGYDGIYYFDWTGSNWGNKSTYERYDINSDVVIVAKSSSDNTAIGKFTTFQKAYPDNRIYFDATGATGWGDKAYFRYGFDCVAHADPMTKFPGTASLFYIDVNEAYFIKYTIANNAGWTKANTVYQPSSGCKPTGDYAITHSLNFSQSDINGGDSKITTCVITTPKSSTADGCDWYNYTKTGNASIPTQTVNVGSVSNGKIRVDYYNTSGEETYWEGSGGTSLTVPQSAIITVTAIPNTGYYNSALTVGGGAFTSGSTYTVTATTAIAATFARSYAFIEGRFRVYNAARNTRTSVGGQGSWVKNSTNIPMSFDGTNGRFELHTYSTPAELKAAFTGGTGDADPYFYIKTSTASNSISSGNDDGPAEYWATSTSSNGNKLLNAGTANKRAVSKTSDALTFVGNSSSKDEYVILYCDGSYVWYELEYTLEYSAGTGSGTAPASKTYYNKGSKATVASNTFTAPLGYHFHHWSGSDGKTYAASDKVTMNSNVTLTAIWALDYPTGYIYITDVMATPATKAGTTITATITSATYKSSLSSTFNTNRVGYEEWAKTTGSGNYQLTFSSALDLSSYSGGVDIDVWWGANDNNRPTYIKINGGSQQDLDAVTVLEDRNQVRKATFHTDVTSLSSIQVLGPSSSGSNVVWFRIGIKEAEVSTYSITYHCNDATSGCPSNLTEQTALPDPLPTGITKNGYTFGGWYTDEDCTVAAVAGDDLSDNADLYAKWTCTTPTISADPSDATVCKDATKPELSVTASANGGTLTYQWYSNTTKSTSDATLLTDSTKAKMYAPTGTAGTKYYFCVVTNTTGGCSATSDIATVTVKGAATITWGTQPADGTVGDDDFAYAVSCSDGSSVTVTSNNTDYATIVDGKLHYVAAGTTYLIATATDACGNEIVQNSSSFTVSVALSSEKKLLGLKFSNGFDAFINESSHTVQAYYLYGTSAPTITSHTESAAATYAIDGTTITMTAENGTTQDYELTLSTVSPYAGTGSEETFTGSETYIKGGVWESSMWTFQKNKEDRPLTGKNRLYFFVTACEKITLKSGGDSRAMKVYRNGVELATPTASGSSGSTIDIEGTAGAAMYALVSNQTSGSGKFSSITITPRCTDPGLAFAADSKTTTLCDAAPTNALTNTHSVAVSYTSSDETVATVASDGTLTIKKAGTTTITASSLEQTVSAVDYCADEASYTLTVSASTAAGLAYGTSTVKKDVGDDAFTNALTNSNGLTVTYTSIDEDVATIDSDGEVTIKAAGTTTITASSAQQKVSSTCYAAGSATYTLTVYPVYTVTYNAMGGTCATSRANTSLGKVTLPSASHDDYTTYTWVEEDGTEAGDAGDNYEPSGNVTLYAKWQGSCAGGGGSGTSVYKFHTKSGIGTVGNIDKSVTAANAADVTATKTNGSYLSELSGGTLGMHLESNGDLQAVTDSCIYYKDNTAYLQPSLTYPGTIQRGDILRYRISGSAIDVRTSTSGYSANTDVTLATGRNNALVSNSMHGLSSVYLYRNTSSAAYITYFEIYRPSEVLFYAEAAIGMTAGNVSAKETQRTTSDYLTYINGGNLYTGGNSDGDVKITANELQLKSNNGYIKITLSKALAEGDIIIFNSSNNYQPGITLTKSRSTTISTANKIYTIPADNSLIGESTIYLWRGSGDTNIRTLAIVRPGGGTCYSVTYDGNGATSGYTNDPAQYAKDADPEVLDCGYTRTGYAFMGWADGTDHRDAGTVDYQPGDHITSISDDVKLYAIWKQIKYFTTEGNWNTSGNWSPSGVPAITDPVVIQANVTVDINNAKALRVDIETGNTLTINAGKALIIAETLTKNGGATAAADVIINSDRTTAGVGALIIGGETGTNKATVNFETKAKNDGGWVNQFIGSPFSDNEPYVDYAIQLYKFEPRANGDRGWWWTHSSGTMIPFWGYNVLYNDASELDVTWTGTLNASTSKTISGLYYNGSSETDNMFANSWTAPIHVGEIEEGDIVNASKTLYMFNAGTPAQEEGQNGSNADNNNSAPGTYISIPIHTAPYAGIGVIPSMQAFYVEAKSSGASITLDYNKIVYTPALTSVGIVPNRAPKHNAEVVEPEVIKLHVQSETGWGANTYVLGRADFAEGYEDGWDGAYIEGESATPKLYTPSIDGNMFINCLPEIEGTVVGFRKGSSDNNYIFSFDYDGDEVWYLNDQKAQKSTQIMNGQTYAFVSEAGDNAARFVISATPINKIATGCESVGAEAAKVRKVIIDDKVYIIRGGQVFDVLGKTIKK